MACHAAGVAPRRESTVRPALVKVEQVCHDLQISRQTVIRLMKSGQLRSVTIGRSRRILVTDVEALLASRSPVPV